MPLFAIYYTLNNTRYVKWFNTKHSANYLHVYIMDFNWQTEHNDYNNVVVYGVARHG